MPEKPVTAFFAAVKADARLEEKLKSGNNIDGALTIANEADLSASKDACLKYYADQTLELSDDEVAGVIGCNHLIGAYSGGKNGAVYIKRSDIKERVLRSGSTADRLKKDSDLPGERTGRIALA